MAQELFSDSLEKFTGTIANSRLAESLQNLQNYLGLEQLNIYSWDDDSIAASLTLDIELPPLGNYEDLDIQAEEPILVVISTKYYPGIAPRVYPDRLSFPKNNLAHLYVAKGGKPPAFCIIRGNIDEWYSNKQLKDLVIRTENWLRDAATGDLTIDNSQFDPIRLEGYNGTIVYDYDELYKICSNKISYLENDNFALGMVQLKVTGEDKVYKILSFIPPDKSTDEIKPIRPDNDVDTSDTVKSKHIGYLFWSNSDNTYKDYFISLPRTWGEFKTFCAYFSVSIDKLERLLSVLNKDTNATIIVGIKRPLKLIGFSGDIEFFNFSFSLTEDKIIGSNIADDLTIKFQAHNQPLTTQKAKEISGQHHEITFPSLIIGCGALGSKIILHFARNGSTGFILSDTDKISAHNLTRHGLLANSIGLNKAKAVQNEIKGLYPYESLSLLAFPISGEDFIEIPDTADPLKWIFDFSASNIVLQGLCISKNIDTARIAKAYLSDFGSLGILLFEGKNRNPRLDDLQMTLYYYSTQHVFIQDWLNRERSTIESQQIITVGVGCNSETTILADDVVSFHASYFSNIIKVETKNSASKGLVFLNQLNQQNGFTNSLHKFQVDAFEVLYAVNNPEWQIRYASGILQKLSFELTKAYPKETGGVFIGSANYKTKTIHVADVITAPPDSKSNPVCFIRGIHGLPEKVGLIQEQSGNMLGYIGEWHTHPHGPNCMSMIDEKTVEEFKNEFQSLPSPLPVFLMIITPSHQLPFIF